MSDDDNLTGNSGDSSENSNSFTEVTEQSWLDRILGSLVGLVIGLVLILIGVALLVWNEGNAVKTAKSLEEGNKVVVEVQNEPVDPAHNHKLVHLTGEVHTGEELVDSFCGLSCKAIRLDRNVEIYQWEEKKSSKSQQKLGGGNETISTYQYDKKWVTSPVDSSHFKESSTHSNTTEMIVQKLTTFSRDATVGAFHLPEAVLVKMRGGEHLSLTDENFQKLPPILKERGALIDGSLYFGKDPANPAVGDQRVTYTILKPTTFSIAACQNGSSLEPYLTHAGANILLVAAGEVSSDLMFNKAESDNEKTTWILRLVGFLLIFVGFLLLFSPLVVLADVIPFLGDLLGGGVGVVAFLLSLATSLATISASWIAYRPILGILMIVAAVGLLVLKSGIKSRKKLATA